MHLVCGETLFDIFIDAEARDDSGASHMLAVPGGSPFNVAVGLARLGAKVALATDLAHDALGDRLAARLIAEGVNGDFLRRGAVATPLAFVTLDNDGVPSYDFRGLCDATFAPNVEGSTSLLPDVASIHVGSISLVLPSSRDDLTQLVQQCSASILVSFDPNVRLAIEPERRRWRDMIERLRPLAHIVKVSLEDLASAYGADLEPQALCEQWLTGPTELVVLTCGAAGAKIFTRRKPVILVPVVAAPLIDTVGAGDSFMAALLARLAQTGHLTIDRPSTLILPELQDLGRYAAPAAALTCARRGPSLPSKVEVERLTATGLIAA